MNWRLRYLCFIPSAADSSSSTSSRMLAWPPTPPAWGPVASQRRAHELASPSSRVVRTTATSMCESSENCLPDMSMPRTRRRVDGDSWCCWGVLGLVASLLHLDLAYRYAYARIGFGQKLVGIEYGCKRAVNHFGRKRRIREQQTGAEGFTLLLGVWQLGSKISYQCLIHICRSPWI